MFERAPLERRSLDLYSPIVGERAVAELYELARPLLGRRVLHLTTPGPSGADEAINLTAPFLLSLGLVVEWQVVPVPEDCARAVALLERTVTRGEPVWTRTAHAGWLRFADLTAARFDREYDFVVVHDPQLLALLAARAGRERARPPGKWIWACHHDLRGLPPEVWGALSPHALQYDAVVFPAREFVPSGPRQLLATEIPPLVDPLSPRNRPLPPETVAAVLRRYALDPRRPLVCQVSPVDRQTDPVALMDAVRLARPQAPGLQLALVVPPRYEAISNKALLKSLAERARLDEGVRVLTSRQEIGEVEVNALQRAALAVIQMAVGHGFAPALNDALWKERPVIAGRSGGLPLQVMDGKTGYVVDSAEGCGLRILDLLNDAATAARMGRAGRERVRRKQLVTRGVREYLALFRRLL